MSTAMIEKENTQQKKKKENKNLIYIYQEGM